MQNSFWQGQRYPVNITWLVNQFVQPRL